MKDKTVYILGAGFSYDAGIPTQNKLISKAFSLKDNFKAEEFDVFKGFLSAQLNIADDKIADDKTDGIDLEDIFTPLDRCLSDNTQFRGINLDRITKVRQAAFYVIRKTIDLSLNLRESPTNSSAYIEDFSKYLTELSSIRKDGNYGEADPVSVISTNWDTLLDRSIYQYINNEEPDKKHDAVVDYCCHISSLTEDDHTIKPALEILGKGGFGVKLLKLHGSLNWLQCPRCMRLYTSLRHDDIDKFDASNECRHCDKNFEEEKGNHILVSNLIMPTFIKDLSNPQYKIIWQNAGIEISEATKIVFIGYSLPSADFEMRQLLSRMTRKNAKIEVVDYQDEKKMQVQVVQIKKHWHSFFGQREIKFHFCGAKQYVDNLINNRVDNDNYMLKITQLLAFLYLSFNR